MTVVLAAQGNDFVVLGADSRGIMGDMTGPLIIGMDRMRKLRLIAEHVCVLTFGIGEFGESLLEGFRGEMEPNLDGVTNISERFRVYCRDKWKDWLGGIPPQMHPNVGFMIAGLDRRGENGEYSIPNTYSITSKHSFAPALHRYGFACMGLTPLATYILNRRYQEGMTVNDLCSLVAYAISEIASVDSRVGGPIRIAIIDPEGSRELPEEDIQSMLESVTW